MTLEFSKEYTPFPRRRHTLVDNFRECGALPRWKNSLQTSAEIQRLKRDAVLREAGRAFSVRGFHNTSLDDVAKALQVSKGTLYNYVKDKQEILWEFHRLAYDIGKRAFEDAQAKGGSGAEVLRNCLVLYIHGLTQELGACGALVELDALRPEDRAQAVKLRDSFEESFISVIRAGMRDGSIRDVDPRLAVFTFMGAINWLPRWYSPRGRLSGAAIAELMTDLLLSGLVTDAGRSGQLTNAATAAPAPIASDVPSVPVRKAKARTKSRTVARPSDKSTVVAGVQAVPVES